MLALRRLPATACALITAVALTGCSAAVDALGPRPNQTLVSLAQQATADAETMEASDIQQLRALHAEQLYEEIERLCGRDETGAVPSSCEVERNAGETAYSPDPLGVYLTVNKVPAESSDLVNSQAIDIAAHHTSDFEAVPVTESEREIITNLLEAEFAAVYAVDMARAYVSPEEASLVDELVEAHELRILTLQNCLPEPLIPPAAYTGSEEDFGRGMEYIAEVENALESTWRAAAGEAHSPDTRGLIIRGAGDMVAARYQAGF